MIIELQFNNTEVKCYDIINNNSKKQPKYILELLNSNKNLNKTLKKIMKEVSQGFKIVDSKYITSKDVKLNEEILLFPIIIRFDQYRDYLNRLQSLNILDKIAYSVEELPKNIICNSIEDVKFNDQIQIVGYSSENITVQSDQSGTLFDTISERILGRAGTDVYRNIFDLKIRSKTITFSRKDYFKDEYGVLVV